ncbi:chloride channel protein [Nitratifractor sp.]|uniref:chloride channel protein n=1 Tax=Nitratifractor sp. TaxID=2268144 RepID=UPI0025ECEBAF|nr:chloride channel protein [Nitratifractor sp.]
MRKIKEIFKQLIFGDKEVDVRGRLLRLCKKDLCSMDIRIDSISIIFFLGRWLPFSIAVGITMGVIASLMDLIVIEINGVLSTDIIYLFLYPILVAAITGAVIRRNHEVSGPGIGFSILHLRTKRYIRMRSILAKLFISVLTLSGGFIAGREGPSFFLGIGIGEWVGKAYGFGKKFKNMLGLIGGGAFTGALLKAPLGSSIFAMELENMYDFDYRPFVPMIVASIVSYLTFSFFRGNHAFIQLTHKAVWTLDSIPYIIAMGFAVSLVIYGYTLFFHFLLKLSKMIPLGRRPLIGTVVAIPFMLALYLISGDVDILSAPVNMNILSNLAQMSFPLGVDFAIIVFTIIITSLTLGFGIPGGLILPVLIIGAAMGNIFGHIFPGQLVMFTLAGMGAGLSAGAKTPLAAIVMITEMSHDDVVIPMTAAVITSYLTSFGYSLYLGQENIFRSSLKDFRSYSRKPSENEKQ